MNFWRFLLVGFLAGWIVGRALRGRSFGWLGSTLLGGVGSLLGAYLFGFFGWTANSPSTLCLRAVFGAVTLMLLISFVKPAPKRVPEESE